MTWAFVVVAAAFVGVLAYLGVRFINVLEAMVNVLSKRQISSDYQVSSPTKDTAFTARAVEQLSPEIIAPNLFKPPRPRGGFGSKINYDTD